MKLSRKLLASLLGQLPAWTLAGKLSLLHKDDEDDQDHPGGLVFLSGLRLLVFLLHGDLLHLPHAAFSSSHHLVLFSD